MKWGTTTCIFVIMIAILWGLYVTLDNIPDFTELRLQKFLDSTISKTPSIIDQSHMTYAQISGSNTSLLANSSLFEVSKNNVNMTNKTRAVGSNTTNIVMPTSANQSLAATHLGPTSCQTNLPISVVTASGSDGNVPQNVLDNNLNTRWSSFGIGSWIRADLSSPKAICGVEIAWYNGTTRVYNFTIATSIDGNLFTNVTGTSSGTTVNSERYTFAKDARFVTIVVNGNSENNWASITELDIFS